MASVLISVFFDINICSTPYFKLKWIYNLRIYIYTYKIRYSKIKLIYHLKEVFLFEQNSKILSNKISVK